MICIFKHKLIFSLLIISLSTQFIFCQETDKIKILDQNQTAVRINSNGLNFLDNTIGAGFKVTKNDIKSIFYNSTLWLAGIDEIDSLRVSADEFGFSGRDFFPGPFNTLTNPNIDIEYTTKWKKQIWKISKQQISNHINYWQDPNYNIPEDILTWPGNGNVKQGISKILAPFADLNNDSIYSPEKGEYPLIKGDETVFFILNDINDKHTESKGLPIGIEVQVMAYQYKPSDSFLDSTTFISYKITNKGTHKFDSLYSGMYVDSDVGGPADDFFGSDSTKNLIYFYNGDNYDDDYYKAKGYGENPPAASVMLLNKQMNGSICYFGGSANNMADPTKPTEYLNYLKGKWRFGEQLVYGGQGHTGTKNATNNPTKYIYSGNPYTKEGWSEVSNGNLPGDRRGLMCIKPFKLYPNETQVIDFAFFAGTRFEDVIGASVLQVQQNADSCVRFYKSTKDSIFPSIAQKDNNIYPEPNLVYLENNNSTNYFQPNITLLDGKGNGSNWLELSTETKSKILKNNKSTSIQYERRFGPIKVEIIDTNNLKEGYYLCKFYGYTADSNIYNSNFYDKKIDSAKWVIYNFDKENGTLLDSVYSNNNITINKTQLISKWGIKVTINQTPYQSGSTLFTEPLKNIVYSTLSFENNSNKWLTTINDIDNYTPFNWIRSGNNISTTNENSLGINNPFLYSNESIDIDEVYENINDGGIAPFCLVGYQGDFMPIAFPNEISQFDIASIKSTNSIEKLPNVDLVLTSDTSLWTKCPVLELGRDTSKTEGKAKAGTIRKGNSIDKKGNKIANKTGESWFPGYAIDLDKGIRLHIAFGENSMLKTENGADMKWNPTSNIYHENVDSINHTKKIDYLFGGQHPIYIFGENVFGSKIDTNRNCPAYDGINNWLFDKLDQNLSKSYRDFFCHLQWVINPILIENHSVLESNAVFKLRVNKAYNDHKLSNKNKGKPLFSWNIDKKTLNISKQNLNYEPLVLYPNPNNGQFGVMIPEHLKNTEIIICNLYGSIIMKKTYDILDENENFNLKLTPGMYIVKIGNYSSKLIIE